MGRSYVGTVGEGANDGAIRSYIEGQGGKYESTQINLINF